MNAHSFATHLIADLTTLHHAAQHLTIDSQPKTAAIGLQYDHGFLPLFGLAAPTPTFAKMMLHRWQDGDWVHTFKRGTPKALAQILANELDHLWLDLALEFENP